LSQLYFFETCQMAGLKADRGAAANNNDILDIGGPF
jgi:hypothetical protein